MSKGAGFREVPIRELMAAFHDGPHATPKPAAAGPVFLGIKNITEDGRLDLSSIRHIDESDFPRWTRRVMPQADDIVFTYEATLHRYALIPEGFHGCLGRRLALIRPRRDVVDPAFLHLAMRGPDWRQTVEGRVISGATVDRVPLVDFPDFRIAVPPLAVQRRIASLLAAFDRHIDVNHRRIELLERTGCALYTEWFERQGRGSQRAASDIFELNPRVETGNSPVSKVTMADVNTMHSAVLPSMTTNRCVGSRFQRDDVLLARITPCLENGKTALVKFLHSGEMAVGSTEFIVMRGRIAGPAFTYCCARSDRLRSHASKSMTGSSGRQRVSVDSFASLQLCEPTRETAEEFERVVGPMLEYVYCLAVENRRLAATRDLLLPRLVSGRLDISDVDLGALTPDAAAA